MRKLTVTFSEEEYDELRKQAGEVGERDIGELASEACKVGMGVLGAMVNSTARKVLVEFLGHRLVVSSIHGRPREEELPS